jgi:hypothetical protein
MSKNRKIQLFGMALMIIAAVLVTLSAVKAPAPTLIPFTGSNAEGLAIYQASEHSANIANQKGLAIYAQSEHVLAYPARSNEAGLAIYHQSEWMEPANWATSSDPLFQYHQSEWFGK